MGTPHSLAAQTTNLASPPHHPADIMHQESQSSATNGAFPACAPHSLASEATNLVSPPHHPTIIMHQESSTNGKSLAYTLYSLAGEAMNLSPPHLPVDIMRQESQTPSANEPPLPCTPHSATDVASPPQLSDELVRQESPSSPHLPDATNQSPTPPEGRPNHYLPAHHQTVSKSGASYTFAPGTSGTVITIDDSEDEPTSGTPSCICGIVGSDILDDDDTSFEYSGESVDDL